MKLSQILDQKGWGTMVTQETATVAEAVTIMCRKHVGCVVVRDRQEQVVGMLTERDILRYFASSGANLAAMRVCEVMTEQVTTASPDMCADEAMALMTKRRFRHLPIMEAGKLLGLVSLGDLVKAQLAEKEAESTLLREYITHA